MCVCVCVCVCNAIQGPRHLLQAVRETASGACCTRSNELGCPRGTICLGLLFRKQKKRMSVEDLCVFLVFCQFLVVRFKECLEVLYIRVAVSMLCDQADEWAASILVLCVGVYALTCFRGSRFTPRKRQSFDSTKGCPGEDVDAQSPSATI